MRKIVVGALQPRRIFAPEPLYWSYPNYDNDPERIMREYASKSLELAARLLDRAGGEGCGAVTTCEDADGIAAYGADISETNVFPELVRLAQPASERAFAEAARRNGMHVVGCYHVEDKGSLYNAASIFDRKGDIVGHYRKTHLPAEEAWQLTPGDSLDVFDLEFGRVGVSICYDMMFPESVQTLALKGAEIIFHPTYGYGWYDSIGEATLRARANDYGVYIVTAKNYVRNGAGKSGVVDPWGNVLAEAGFYENAVVTKLIDLDERKWQDEAYFSSCLTRECDVAKRLRAERRPEIYGELVRPNGKLAALSHEERLRILNEDIRGGKLHW